MYLSLFNKWQWNILIMCFVFSLFLFFFYKKNKWRLHTTYPKRELPLKAPKNLFFESTFAVSHSSNHCRHHILSTLDLRAEPRKFQKYYLFSMGLRKHLDWRGATHSSIGVLEMPLQVKFTKMPLVSPRLTKSQNWVKSIPKQHFLCAYIKPELLSDFCQVWPEVDSRALEILILIWPS